MKKTPELMKEGIKKVCLSGEGRGRFSFQDEKQSFQYESFLNKGKKSWTVAYHFPLHGEERLVLGYKEALAGDIEVEGSLYKKLIDDTADEVAREKVKNLFRVFFLKFGHFLEIYDEFQRFGSRSELECLPEVRDEGRVRGQCFYGPKNETVLWEVSKENFHFSFPFHNGDHLFSLHFDRERKSYFSKWTGFLQKKSNRSFRFKVEKYITECVM
ncbi:MAG: hypothetical protein VYD54_12385 [Bdellovibrionota bacterium]|nr:hypothetical protein [Bdellovibrionota bacterium]